jgi:hypothetical protein
MMWPQVCGSEVAKAVEGGPSVGQFSIGFIKQFPGVQVLPLRSLVYLPSVMAPMLLLET